MKTLITILLLLMVSGSVWGDFTVGTAVDVNTNTVGSELSIPRWKGWILGDTLYIVVHDDGGNNEWYYSIDDGANWTGVDGALDQSGGFDMHAAVWGQDGVGAHIALPDASDEPGYRFIASPATSSGNRETIDVLSTGWPGAIRAGVCATGDTVIVAFRCTDETCDSLMVYWSDDRFETDTNTQHIPITEDDNRIGLAAGPDGEIGMFSFEYSTGVYAWEWDGYDNGFAAMTDSSVFDDGALSGTERGMTFFRADDEWHFIHGEDISGGAQLVWYHGDGTSWTKDTLSSQTTFDQGAFYAPLASVYGDDRVFLLYNALISGDTTLCMKEYNGTTWDADSTLVASGVNTDEHAQTAPLVDSTFGYVPVWYESHDDGYLYFLRIYPDAAIEITTLPYTCSVDDTTYTLFLSGDCSGADGITVDADNITIDLNSDTVCFGTNGADPVGSSPPNGDYGISIANGADSVTIHNGWVIHDPPADSIDATIPLWAYCVILHGNNHHITFDSVNFIVRGRNSKVLLGNAVSLPIYNIEMNRCIIYDSMNAFTTRHNWDENSAIVLNNCDDGASMGSDFSHHLMVDSCTIYSPWCGIYAHGDSIVTRITNNNLTIDGRNDIGVAPATWAQAYAISFRDNSGDVGVRIWCVGNRIIAGTSYGGGRGIFLSSVDGIAADSVYIADNYIEVHMEHDGEERVPNGIIMRQGVSNALLLRDTIVVVLDSTTGVQGYDYGPGYGIRMSSAMENVTIRDCDISTYFSTNWTPGYGISSAHCAAICFDEFAMNESGIVIDSNTFRSNSLLIKWGFFNGHGGNVTMRDNTFASIDTSNQDLAYTYFLEYGAGGTNHAYGNISQNGTYTGLASDTAGIYCWDGEPDSLSISINEIVTITTTAGATCTMINDYGDTISSGTANGSGIYVDTTKYWEEFNDTFTESDSTDFNPFIICAKSGSDSTMDTVDIAHDNSEFTLTIAGSSVDITPTLLSGKTTMSGKAVIDED